MDFYERIKLLASEKKLSLNRIERDLSYPRNALSNYKHGKEPSARRLNEISRYFAVSKDYLLGETDQRTSLNGADELSNLLGSLTEARKNEVLRFLNEKATEQNNESNLLFDHLGTIEVIEIKSINGLDAFKQGRPNAKALLPFDEIPTEYDAALQLTDLNYPLSIRGFAESLIRNGDILFIAFPKGSYDPLATIFELMGATYIESTDKNGETIYIRDDENSCHGKKNTVVLLKLYHSSLRK